MGTLLWLPGGPDETDWVAYRWSVVFVVALSVLASAPATVDAEEFCSILDTPRLGGGIKHAAEIIQEYFCGEPDDAWATRGDGGRI